LIIFAFCLDETEKSLLRQWNVTYLYIDYFEHDEHSIFSNNHTGGSLAAQYLLDKGASKVCYISVTPQSDATINRYEGFTEHLRSQGYQEEIGLYESTLSETHGYEVGQQIVNDGLYDGVFCYCDEIALGVLLAVREAGAHIKVVGFDGIHSTRYVKLSTISQGPKQIGTLAVETLMNILHATKEEAVISHEISPFIVDYDS